MTEGKNFTVIVNGQKHSLAAIPGETLADLLRNRLRLTGTKIGCNEAECGSCTVLVDGEPILSCNYPAERAEGKNVVTIEGLTTKTDASVRLHPLQEAFIVHGAVQCGFCIPGQIMTAYALLQKNPDPTSKDIRTALKDTLCRCAGYPSIENAIQAAAASMRTGQPVKPTSLADTNPSKSNPMLLAGLVKTNPNTSFVLLHGGYPFTSEAAILAKSFENVYLDANWLPLISPTAMKRALQDWLDSIPLGKIMIWGGDSYRVEGTFASLLLAKQVVSEVLAERVQAGHLIEGQVRTILWDIFRNTSARFYRTDSLRNWRSGGARTAATAAASPE